MQSSHGKSRWRPVDADDELMLPVSRTDDDHLDSYSRSHNHSNRSNTQKMSTSDRYAYSETTSSHRRKSDWRTDDGTRSSNRDRHDDDDHNSSRRDKRIDPHSHQSAQDSRYRGEQTRQSSRHSHKDWRHSQDDNRLSSHTAENGSWANSSRYERDREDRGEWMPNDKGRYERDADYHARNDHSARRAKERRYDDEDLGSRDSQSDDRHRESTARDHLQVEERSWEPAASWKPKEKSLQNQASDGYLNRSSDKRYAKGSNQSRRNQYTQRRDRRDDNDMNK